MSKFQNKCKTIQQIKVDNTLNTLGLIAKHWRNNVTIPIIGITGTDKLDTIGFRPDDVFGVGTGLDEYSVCGVSGS